MKTSPTGSTSPRRPRTTRSSSTSPTMHETGQPVLVGTRDVAESEELHERLVRRGVPAVLLNAKNDAEEAAGHRRGRQVRHGHGVHPDGRARHRHPARRIRRSRPRQGRRAGRAARRRHRPPSHRAAGQPAARPRRTPGRPGFVGVLLQLGGRRRRGQPGSQQAARRRPTRTAGSSAPRPPRCSTTRSASPRAGCWTCTPTPGATTS